jgi:hypothetical protein
MKRYLTECQDGRSSPGALQLKRQYHDSVTLPAEGLSLVFDIAQVFVGPRGDAASISADPNNLIREGSDGKMFARMEWTGIPNW